MSSDEPEILRQWRHVARYKSRARRARRKAARTFCFLAAAIIIPAGLYRAMAPRGDGPVMLGTITAQGDGLYVVNVRERFETMESCLDARALVPAPERIMSECVAR